MGGEGKKRYLHVRVAIVATPRLPPFFFSFCCHVAHTPCACGMFVCEVRSDEEAHACSAFAAFGGEVGLN